MFNIVEGTASDLIKSDLYYEVSITDNLDPNAPVFVVGHNGRVSSYPTRKPIRLSGREIRVLMDAQIPKEKIEMQDGLRRIVGFTYTDRFSINMKKFGAFTSSDGVVIQPFGTVATHIDADASLKNDPAEDYSVEIMPEPEPEIEAREEETPIRKPDPLPAPAPVPEPPKDPLTMEEVRRDELDYTSRNQLMVHAKSLGIDVPRKMSKQDLIDSIMEKEFPKDAAEKEEE